MNILVLCTGNSARSLMLECVLNRLGLGRIAAYSAGSKPTGDIHPQSVTLLENKAYDVDCLRSKSWDEFARPKAPKMDVVITVCASAAGEACPLWPGTPLRAHWGIEDPAKATKEDWPQAFDTAYNLLNMRAKALTALDFNNMSQKDLQIALDQIGHQSAHINI